jgi:uncharacterized membrane protein
MDEDRSADKPDNASAESGEENLTQKQLQEILNRVTYMERVLRDQLSRLYEIEMRMGITPPAFQSQPQPPRQPAPPQFARPPAPPSMPERPAARRPLEQPPSRPAQPTPPQNQAPPVERQAGVPRQSQTSPSIPTETSGQQADSAQPGQARPTAPRLPSSVTHSTAPSQSPSFPPPAPPKSHGDLEFRIGGSWLGIIGVIAVVFGVGYFLKEAFDRGWITPTYQVWTGIVIGVGFLAAGEWLRKKYASYAYGLTGGGILILYLSAWASSELYDVRVLEPKKAFIFMAMITALASILAARYNTLIIAILGFIGGFLTPILLSTGSDNEVGLFSYIALLDLGVLTLAFSKQWRSLNYLSFAATVLMVAAWMGRSYAPTKLWTTIIFLTIFFAIYALLAVLYNVVNKRPTIWLDLAMVFINAMLYFGTTYLLLNNWADTNKYHKYLGGFAVLMSAFYGLLGYLTYNRDREDRLLIFTFCGLAFLFLVLAVPIQFDQQWVTMAWAIEGAIMTWVGLRVKDRTSLYASFCVFGIAVFHWLSIDAAQFGYRAGETFVPLLNNRALSCAVLVASLATASWLYKRFGSPVKDQEQEMFSALYLLGANIFAITLLSLDVNSYFEQKRATTDATLTHEYQRIGNTHMFTLSVLWALYGAAALFIGIMRKLIIIRIVALCLLVITALKVLATDLWYYDSTWHTTIFNQTFASFAVVIAAFACGAWLYSRSDNIKEGERNIVLPLLVGAANVLALIALSAEVIGHFNRQLSPAIETLAANTFEENKQFVLSVLWTVYGAIALTLGIKRGARMLQAGGLILFLGTIIKLVFVDLTYYDSAAHTTIFNQTFASFAVMIAALALASWLYARSENIESEVQHGLIPAMITVANLLALVALSAEVIGHFNRQGGAGFGLLTSSPLEEAKQFALSVLWTVYAAAALLLGIKRGAKLLRAGGMILLAVTIFKLIMVDLHYYNSAWHTLLINRTFGAFVLMIVALASGAWLYTRSEAVEEEERLAILPVMIVAVNILALTALSAEAWGYYGKKISEITLAAAVDFNDEKLSNLKLAQRLSLSVIWAIYGGAMLTLGIIRRSQLLRIMALSLLSLTILKVFFIDLAALERLYRIISFIVLGVILLAVSFLYQRFRFLFVDAKDDTAKAEKRAP